MVFYEKKENVVKMLTFLKFLNYLNYFKRGSGSIQNNTFFFKNKIKFKMMTIK